MFSGGLRTAVVTSVLFLVSAEVAFGQTFNVNDYGASGSANTGTCSGQVGSSILTNCQTGTYDWKVGQVIRIAGGGPPPSSRVYDRSGSGTFPTQAPSKVTTIVVQDVVNGQKVDTPASSSSGSSGHLYCYSVSIADPLQGISAPSDVTCNPSGQPSLDLSINNYNNLYAATGKVGWRSPIFLWYVSKDRGNFNLLAVTQARNEGDPGDNVDSGEWTNDFGQASPAQALLPVPMLPGAADTLAKRGGWRTNVTTSDPTTIPPDVSQNESLFAMITAINGNQVAIDCPPNVTPFQDKSNCVLGSTITGAMIYHDDTYAAQMAIDAAASAGGGTVQFGAGTYNIQQPSVASSELTNTDDVDYPKYTTDINKVTGWSGFSFLHIKVPAGQKGNVHLAGLGSSTILQTPPDQAGWASLFAVGDFTRADDIIGGVIGINPIDKGSTQVSLASGSASPGLKVGDDVLLFSGSFGYKDGNFPCPLQQSPSGVSAGECHYTELNTIASIAEGGTTYNLVYPTAKNFFSADDGKSAFGMVKMRDRTPHNIMLYNMALNTYDHIFGTGNVYGLTVDAVQVNGYVNGGAFNGGFKRDVTLKNSSWGVGRGDLLYSSEEEYDGFTNLQIFSNTIYGFSPNGAAGPSIQAKLSATEGTSQVTYYNNHFYGVSIYFDQTTDDVVDTNYFVDGIISMGVYYGVVPNHYWSYHDLSYASFGSQTYARITSNHLTIDPSYSVPWVIRLGHFDSATLSNNDVKYILLSPDKGSQIIFANSGLIFNNTINITSATSTDAIIALPDAIVSMLGQPVSQPSSLSIQGNTVSAPGLDAGILIPEPGFVDTVPICVAGNNVALVVRAAPGDVTVSCPQ